VGTKHSIILNHRKSTKHAEGKMWLLRKEATEVDIAVAMKQHDADTHRKGETLPEEQHMYQAQVAETCLQAGIY